MASNWMRCLVLSFIAAAAYWLCLRVVFPGYFAPLIPHHSDFYIPVGLLNRAVAEVITFPRPVANLFLRTIGYLGVEGSTAAVIVLVLGGVIGTALLVEQVTAMRLSLIAFALYCLLLFAHPQFYFHHRHDIPAALSYLLALGAVWLLYLYLGSRERTWLIAYFIIVAALGLTKETYYAALVLLVAGIAWAQGMSKRLVLAISAGTLITLAGTFAINMTAYRRYLSASVTAGEPYEVSLYPASVLAAWWTYVRELASPLAAALVVIAVAAVWGRRPAPVSALLLVVAGLASLLPHAALPNHIELQYAWVAAPLFFAPLLMVPWNAMRSRILWSLMAAMVFAWTLTNRSSYRSTPQQWLIGQEHMNARILPALDTIEQTAGSRVLVSGLRASYHPWLFADFITWRFGQDRTWTCVTGRNGPHGTTGSVTLAPASAVDPRGFDTAVLFMPDGRLQRIIRESELAAHLMNNPDVLLAPALGPLMQKLQSTPGDFQTLLNIGVEYLDWGLLDRAAIYLERAAEANPSNPYPQFFLAQLHEARGDYDQARRRYEHAIAVDVPPGNPAFRQALSALPHK